MDLFKLPFNKKNRKAESSLQHKDQGRIPNHVAIIMDGNGRWAQKRGLPRVAGHKEGMDNIKKVVRKANQFGIEVLTIYAFSTENWKRPTDEIEYLLKLPIDFLQHYLPELMDRNVKIQTIGEVNALPQRTKDAIKRAVDQTTHNTGLVLNIAINYGSRHEMIHSVKQICQGVIDGAYSVDDINEDMLNDYLFTADLGDPDLIIRTSGELRLSNFLLWQAAYSELWFTDILWPDFDGEQFEKAIYDFQRRKRRYGGV
ncbi:isoprenyl transferase [Gracilibacillus sp. YIM 98692]|uniref:isoprenyl transferase n=1 Tax=Gracilibacillus sp. YIM 98692 TaxID=2663532 RepID=UPI0013D4998B|nr:isoprenyl transferase [Gracilibacillus sp. YIM 98692]